MMRDTWIELRRPFRLAGGLPTMHENILTASQPLDHIDMATVEYTMQLRPITLDGRDAGGSLIAWLESGHVVQRFKAKNIVGQSSPVSSWENVKPPEAGYCDGREAIAATGCAQTDNKNVWWFTSNYTRHDSQFVVAIQGYAEARVTRDYGTPFHFATVDKFVNLSRAVLPYNEPCPGQTLLPSAAWPPPLIKHSHAHRFRRSSVETAPASEHPSSMDLIENWQWAAVGLLIATVVAVVLQVGLHSRRPALDVHAAAMTGDLIALRHALLHNPAVKDQRDVLQRTPAIMAAIGAQAESLRILHAFEADLRLVDIEHRSALHWAVLVNATDATSLLLSYKADVLTTDKLGNTPVHLAAREGHIDMIRLLLNASRCTPEAAITLLHVLNDNGQSAIDVSNEPEEVQTLLDELWEALRQSGQKDDLETIMKRQKVLGVKRKAWHRAKKKRERASSPIAFAEPISSPDAPVPELVS
eukprot:TRINITY_DN11195_c0_g1_i1.p1 TRINITY_DN11195_c0_g1~~TRINITY_DN11195_c0_g1_i1.p1  ORF type:complete len:472 (+),score=91.70 TRINITY_DN11195_c0_g1_i1:312-1727(+)